MISHPYPDHAYLERDPETNENRWFSTMGMGVRYVHEDRSAEYADAAVAAERARCAKFLQKLHDELQETMALGARPLASMVTGALRDAIAEILNPSN